jgi:hypothetical protein
VRKFRERNSRKSLGREIHREKNSRERNSRESLLREILEGEKQE